MSFVFAFHSHVFREFCTKLNTLRPTLGIFGGTFDPVHHGHTQSVIVAAQQAGVQSVAMLPCHIPVHKAHTPSASQHRLAMLKLAIEQYPQLYIDEREIQRETPSYTIHTLRALRDEYPKHPLCFIIGMDSLHSLLSWNEWQALFDYCHFVVCCRPGTKTALSKELTDLLAKRQVSTSNALHNTLNGKIFLADTPELAISSSEIRQRIVNKLPTDDMLDPKVRRYIQTHKLYQPSTTF
jgi:nicotinate-nucleotide adenylyltransferase